MTPSDFSAVIVTRGDVDLGEVIKPILAAGIEEIIIRVSDSGVWERYVGALMASRNVVFCCDDDCVVDAAAVVAAYEPKVVTCNMPDGPGSHRSDYPDGIALMGWGSVFDRKLIPGFNGAFARYDRAGLPRDATFFRECDRVFTGLNKLKLIDVPFRHLPWAKAPNRLAEQPDHGEHLKEIRRRIQVVRNG